MKSTNHILYILLFLNFHIVSSNSLVIPLVLLYSKKISLTAYIIFFTIYLFIFFYSWTSLYMTKLIVRFTIISSLQKRKETRYQKGNPSFDCSGEIVLHEDRRWSLRGYSLLERWSTGRVAGQKARFGPGGGKVEEGRSWLDPVRVHTAERGWM